MPATATSRPRFTPRARGEAPPARPCATVERATRTGRGAATVGSGRAVPDLLRSRASGTVGWDGGAYALLLAVEPTLLEIKNRPKHQESPQKIKNRPKVPPFPAQARSFAIIPAGNSQINAGLQELDIPVLWAGELH